MTRRVQTWLMTGSLGLAALSSAAAQVAGPITVPAGLRSIAGYTGVITPFGHRAPQLPTVWMVPQYVVYYHVPQPVYVWAAPEQPVVSPVQAERLTLGSSKATSQTRLSVGSTMTWLNAGDEVETLILRRSENGSEQSGAAARWQIRPDGSLSLRFNKPGVFLYHTQDEPQTQGRIIVAE